MEDDSAAGNAGITEKKAPVVKFRKVKSKGKKCISMRRSIDEEETTSNGNSQAEDAEDSSMSTILSIKKKRKLLESLGKQRGLDAEALMRVRIPNENAATEATSVEPEEGASSSSQKLTERLQDTFSGGTGGDGVDGSGDGVLSQKHQEAMEEYIRKQLDSKGKTSSNLSEEQNEVNKTVDEETATHNAKALETKLFEDLAKSGAQLLGKEENRSHPKIGQEGDVGAGGAVLGGTGIAEVALPLDERIKMVRATEEAAAALEQRRAARYGSRPPEQAQPQQEPQARAPFDAADAGLPVSFGSGPAKKKKKEQLDDLPQARKVLPEPHGTWAAPRISKAFSAGVKVRRSDIQDVDGSYSHNFRLHTQEWIEEREKEQRRATESHDLSRQGESSINDRIGFHAARKAGRAGEASRPVGARANESGRGHSYRSKDDIVWKKFMNRERDRR